MTATIPFLVFVRQASPKVIQLLHYNGKDRPVKNVLYIMGHEGQKMPCTNLNFKIDIAAKNPIDMILFGVKIAEREKM